MRAHTTEKPHQKWRYEHRIININKTSMRFEKQVFIEDEITILVFNFALPAVNILHSLPLSNAMLSDM
jgi:hypothetical protein